MTWEVDHRAVAINALGYYWDSGNLVVPPGPSHSSGSGEGSGTADHGDSDLSGVERSNVVASVGRTEIRIGSNLSASIRGLPQVSQG